MIALLIINGLGVLIALIGGLVGGVKAYIKVKERLVRIETMLGRCPHVKSEGYKDKGALAHRAASI